MKKKPTTPRSRVRSILRQLFLRSRERAAALKATNYCCAKCGKKQSKAQGKEVGLEVHHKNGVGNWEAVIDAVFEQLLCHAEGMEPLCKECHKDEHKED